MKKKKQACSSQVFHYAVHLCWLKQRQNKARNKLLKAILKCTSRKELNSVLLFGQFLQDEHAIRQAYNNKLKVLEEAA